MADVAVMEAMALKEPTLINQTDSWHRTALYLLTRTYGLADSSCRYYAALLDFPDAIDWLCAHGASLDLLADDG